MILAALPMTGTSALWLALVLGFIFGVLLNKGRVTDYNVIVNQFRFKDFTVLKVMFTAIIVGGLGVLLLHKAGHANYEIKSAQMLAVTLGAAIFGVGMVLYGYCPGTGVAAIGTGSIHAMVGAVGMLAGGVLYAFSFPWIKAHILPVGDLGKTRLPDLTGIPDYGWFAALLVIAAVVFTLIELTERKAARVAIAR